MENVIALAVQDMHSSCSETSGRAFRRVRTVIPAAIAFTAQGTTVPTSASTLAPASTPVMTAGYGRPQTDGTTKALSSGCLTWSPPV
jgi:hypothetical protein